MSRLRYVNPFRIRRLVQDIRRAASGGGPKAIRIVRVGEPRGVILPSAEIEFEVVAANGTVEAFETALPVPWPYAWTYRLARRLGVPVVSAIDHDKISFEVPVPRLDRA